MTKAIFYVLGFACWTLLVYIWSGAAWYNEGLKDGRKEDEGTKSL